MESVKLDPKTIDAIARKSATYVLNGLKKKKNNDKEMVTAAEAARILGISQSHQGQLPLCQGRRFEMGQDPFREGLADRELYQGEVRQEII